MGGRLWKLPRKRLTELVPPARQLVRETKNSSHVRFPLHVSTALRRTLDSGGEIILGAVLQYISERLSGEISDINVGKEEKSNPRNNLGPGW